MEFCEPESVFSNDRGSEHVVVCEHSVVSANIVRSGKAILVAAYARIEGIGYVQIGVIDRVARKKVWFDEI